MRGGGLSVVAAVALWHLIESFCGTVEATCGPMAPLELPIGATKRANVLGGGGAMADGGDDG